jgi:hypothetical protein
LEDALMNRQGSIFDAFFVLGVVFLLVVVVGVGMYLAGAVNDAFQGMTDISTESKTMLQNVDNDLPGVVDLILVIIIVGLPLVSMVLAFFNNIHPVFFYVSISVLVLIVFAGIVYHDAWERFDGTIIGEVYDGMPMTKFFMDYFGIYSLLVGVMIIIGLYMKTQAQQGYYG